MGNIYGNVHVLFHSITPKGDGNLTDGRFVTGRLRRSFHSITPKGDGNINQMPPRPPTHPVPRYRQLAHPLYQPSPQADPLTQVNGYLQAAQHLCDIQWKAQRTAISAAPITRSITTSKLKNASPNKERLPKTLAI